MRGFTVIEVMAAVVILSIALLSLLQANNQSVLLRAHSQEVTTATLLGQERLATFRTEMDTLDETSEGDFGEAFPQWRWTLEKEEVPVPFDFAGLEPVKTVSGGGDTAQGSQAGAAAKAAAATQASTEEEHTPLQKLTLTIFWPEGVKEGSLTFTEYYAPPPPEPEAAGAPGALQRRTPAPGGQLGTGAGAGR
jgi:prepilin-type N-terminal cleavage/methylation domain-containing protein